MWASTSPDRMSRSNHSGHHHLGPSRWATRYANKVDRAWTHQLVLSMGTSLHDAFIDEVLADWLEEHGALRAAMALRNVHEPELPSRRTLNRRYG